jgi:murein DD-endopeptidase MepM/ murein hydrolase activator NlpD
VSSNLLALVTAANEAREAAEEREAAERAVQEVAQQPPPPPPTTTTTTSTPPKTTTTPTPPPSTPPPPATTTGGYANPLRAISDLNPERIDQGVDYSGYGPIYAIGDGVVLNTVSAGWPGGTFIAYQLTDGPAAGLTVYAAEDIDPAVQVGQQVSANTVLGQMYEGPDGIETGWADASALGLSMAAEYNQFSGANSTAFGYNFSQLLQSVGAPGGILQNDPATGSLPSGWPQW